ncbi:hypothetical protein HR12_07305 [Microbacterium sp. SUBG005]|nr:hypothetical protein HR12_07305 [Microbacterium sp. SUBG005]
MKRSTVYPPRAKLPIVGEVALAIGRARVEGETVQLHDQPLADQHIDIVARDVHLLSDDDAPRGESYDEQRLQAGIRLPARRRGQPTCLGRSPSYAGDDVGMQALVCAGGLPHDECLLVGQAGGDVLKGIWNRLDELMRGLRYERDRPVNDPGRPGKQLGIGAHREVHSGR